MSSLVKFTTNPCGALWLFIKTPEKEYNGVFQVRISSELHKKLAFKAERTGKKMNALVVEALEQSFDTPNYNFNLNDKV